MKILIVTQFYYPENFVIYRIAEQLVKYGHEVDVLTGKPNYGYGHIVPEYKKVKEETIGGVKVHRVNIVARKQSRFSIIRNYLSFWKNSKKWIRKCKNQYDIVYSMSLSPVTILAAGNLYKKKHNVPHVVHCVDLWPESVIVTHAVRKNSLIYKFLYKWSRALYSHADEILIGSPSFESYFNDVLKLGNKEYEYIPQPSLVENSEDESFEFDKDYFNVLYCGNLGTIQLIPLIYESMKLIKDMPIRFHVIGMGPMSGHLENKIKEYGLENNLIYHGPMIASKAAKYFKGCDALYVSLKNDGPIGKTIPNKLVMSMAFSKPILGVISGDGKDILLDAKGSIVSEEDPKALANALVEMSKIDKKELEKMGNNNLTYFKAHFTLDKVCKNIETELLNKLR